MPSIVLGLTFVATLVAVTVTDLARRLIPNRVLLASTLSGVLLAAAIDLDSLVGRGIAAAAAGGFLLVAALIYPGGMGMGDVKLGAVMGIYLGRGVAAALLVAFVAGAVVGIGLLLRDGAAARKRAIPFAPFLAFGGVIALWIGDAMVDSYLDALSS
jgi:leader peptidase (prepilin peptidase)/N-methyltransferase